MKAVTKHIASWLFPIFAGLAAGLAVLLWLKPAVDESTLRHSYAEVVQRTAPSVVNIYTTQIPPTSSPNKGQQYMEEMLQEPSRERILGSLGSGVIVSPDGYILTSHHVIRDAEEILVALPDGRETQAKIVGVDPETDLALLRIGLSQLPYLSLGHNEPISVGDVVLAIGNPLGLGQTVSMGIASATGRNQVGITTFENFIQTDAAINRGNSGGALVDSRGNLIGINTAILSHSGGWEGIGFSTPATTANQIMADLIDYGRVIRGWLGVTVENLTPSTAKSLGLAELTGGLVRRVELGSPAHAGDLRSGDILIGINGKKVKDGFEAMNIITQTRPHTTLTLTVLRQHKEVTLQVTIGLRPPAQ
ncbi:MAG TPA: trypsin-like peptidase domain-containing protein [Alcanivoracaceae bacterium]|nr:trypsin-like peptidase domain-containing protein [Alcanivoracaceae bacterium]